MPEENERMSPYYKELGIRLYEARKARGLSQKNMADILSIRPATYSRYENGKSRITLEGIRILAKELKISVNYLMTGETYDTFVGRETAKQLTSEERDLLSRYKKLDARGRDNVDIILNQEYKLALRQRERMHKKSDTESET